MPTPQREPLPVSGKVKLGFFFQPGSQSRSSPSRLDAAEEHRLVQFPREDSDSAAKVIARLRRVDSLGAIFIHAF